MPLDPDWYDDPLAGDVYDRAGQRISYREWSRLHSIIDYKRVIYTQVGVYVVSTVWLGMNHNFGGGPPLIFETMIFAGENGEPVDFRDMGCWRWSTEAEALEGHESVCLLVQATSTLEEDHEPLELPTDGAREQRGDPPGGQGAGPD